MKTAFRRAKLWGDCSGVAAIEYAFLASLIAVALVGSLVALGLGVSGLWGDVETAVAGTSYNTP